MAGCSHDCDMSCPVSWHEEPAVPVVPAAHWKGSSPHFCPFHGLGGEALPLEQNAMIQEHPALMYKDTGRCRGCWEVPVRRVVLGVAASNLAVMDKSWHPPASLPSPGKQPNNPQQSTLQPTNPPLLSYACCGGRLEGLRRHSTQQSAQGCCRDS